MKYITKLLNKKTLVIFSIVLILFIVFTSIYYVLVNKTSELNNQTQVTNNDGTEFIGKFLRANLKPGWEMYESFRYIPVSYTYEPQHLINQFSLLKNGRQILTLTPELKSGLNICSTLYTFNDTDPNYIESIKKSYEASSPTSYIPLKIVNISEGYSTFKLFNQEVRRQDNNIFIDKSYGNTFDPDCGDLSKNSIYLFGIINVQTNYISDIVSSSFYINLYDQLSTDEYKELDTILNSIRPVDTELHNAEECQNYNNNLEKLIGFKPNLPAKSFLLIDDYLKGFCSISYSNINLYLVNSEGFSSSLELLEKMRLNTMTSDEYVSENIIKLNNNELSLYLMRLPTGRYPLLQVVGAFIDKDKGYYFTIDIDLSDVKLQGGENESILNFNYKNNPSSNLEFLTKVIEADFPLEIFQEYPGNYYKDSRAELIRKYNDNNYPKALLK